MRNTIKTASQKGVNKVKEFMNLPEIIPVTENNIIEEYRRFKYVKHVAKVFGVSEKEVRQILKQAGIKTTSKKRSEYSKLRDNGLSERDFYHDEGN